MKKIATILACTAMLASCHHGRMEADAPGEAIAFSAVGAGLTVEAKSGSTLLQPDTFLDGGKGFLVYGTWSLDEGGSAEIFREQEVTATGGYNSSIGGYECEYSPIKYWSKTGSYDFRAVYPSSDARVLSASSGKTIVAGYSMHMEDYDMMVAYASRNMAGANAIDPVPLSFRHATAGVRFLFKKGDVSTEYSLASFALCHVNTVGTFIWSSDDDDDDLSECWYPSDYRPASVHEWEAATPEDRIPIPKEYDDYTGYQWHYAIPQNLAASGSDQPSIMFAVSTEGSTPVLTRLYLPTAYDNGDDVLWEAGKLYTYKILIRPGNASVTVEVTPWDRYKVAVDDLIF